MAITLEVAGTVRTADTVRGSNGYAFDLGESLTITEWTRHVLEVADATTDSAVNFGGVSTAKLVAIESDGAVTVKVSGGTTAIPVNKHLLITASSSGPTSLTISNASGATRTVEFLIGG